MPEPTETVEEFRLRVASGWPRTCRCSRPTGRRPTGRGRRDAGRATRSCSASCGTAASPGSASRRSTAASGSAVEYQQAFTEESLPYEMPLHLNVPTLQHPRRRPSSTSAPPSRSEAPAAHAPRRAAVGAVPLRAHRRLRPRRVPDPRRARRRRVGAERLQDLEHRGACRPRLGDVPRPHRLGRAQAPRPHHVHHGDPPGRACRSTTIKQVNGIARVLPGVLRRRAAPARLRRRRGERRLDRRAGAARARAQRGRRWVALRERAQLPRRGCRRRVRRQLREDRDVPRYLRRPGRRASCSPRRTCSMSCSAAW